MKKQLFIIAISFLLFPVLGNSQNDFKFGIFGGLNYAHPEGDYIEETKELIEDNIDYYDDSDYYDLDINRGGVIGRVGIHLGVSAEYAVKENVSLMTSISYSQKGFYMFNKIEGEYESFYGDVDIMEKTTIKAKLDYIDIPFLIKYNLKLRFRY